MTPADVEATVRRVLASCREMQPDEITADMSLSRFVDTGFEALDLLIDLERELSLDLGSELPPSTVGALISDLQKRLCHEKTVCQCELRDRQWNPITGRCETCGDVYRRT